MPISCRVACVFLLISSSSLPVFSINRCCEYSLPAYGLLTSFLIKVENLSLWKRENHLMKPHHSALAVTNSGVILDSFLLHSVPSQLRLFGRISKSYYFSHRIVQCLSLKDTYGTIIIPKKLMIIPYYPQMSNQCSVFSSYLKTFF